MKFAPDTSAKSYKWEVIALLWVAYFLNQTDRQVFNIVLPHIQNDLGTADSISIELNKVTRDILEKYKDTPFKDNKALPNYTNQAMNRDIKELCKLAGINEEIRVTT